MTQIQRQRGKRRGAAARCPERRWRRKGRKGKVTITTEGDKRCEMQRQGTMGAENERNGVDDRKIKMNTRLGDARC